MKAFVLISLVSLVFSCAKDESNDENKDAQTEALELAMETATANQSVEITSQALEQLDQALEATAGALVIELTGNGTPLFLDGEVATHGSKWCSTRGSPMASASSSFSSLRLNESETNSDGSIKRTHENYAARFFHCLLKIDSGSSDTVRGTYSLVKGIICALEKAEALDFDNPGTKNVTFKIESDCFHETMVSEMAGQEINLDAETKILDELDNWDKQISMTNLKFGSENQTESHTFQLRNTRDVMAVRFHTVDSAKENSQSAWTFSLTNTGELRYESKDFRVTGSSNDNRRAVRILTKGKLDVKIEDNVVSSKFESVDALEGIYADIYAHPDSTYTWGGSLATIRGVSESGFETRAYVCNSDGAQTASSTTCNGTDISTYYDATKVNKEAGKRSCFPTDKSCEGVTPIEFGSGSEDYFMAKDSISEIKQKPKDWVMSLDQPLSFEAITTDFSQQ